MKRYRLSTDLFYDIWDLCAKLKIDWFYEDYSYRRTINIDDIRCLYDAWIVGFPDDKGNYVPLPLTKNIEKMFTECGIGSFGREKSNGIQNV